MGYGIEDTLKTEFREAVLEQLQEIIDKTPDEGGDSGPENVSKFVNAILDFAFLIFDLEKIARNGVTDKAVKHTVVSIHVVILAVIHALDLMSVDNPMR